MRKIGKDMKIMDVMQRMNKEEGLKEIEKE